MSLTILHTSDWHLGHKFYEYDRTVEQGAFLDWLLDEVGRREVDVLLVAGDVFDVSNPSAAAQQLFYSFLARARSRYPGLQIVVTAGNHDSPSRLDAPRLLTDALDIRIRGNVGRTDEREPDYAELVVPLYAGKAREAALAQGTEASPEALCLAVPYLHEGDYPKPDGADRSMDSAVAKFYRCALEEAQGRWGRDLPVVAMGHLYVSGSQVGDSERGIAVGGIEGVSLGAFPDELAYVALGHIHRAQRIGGRDNVRYCGTPYPMSMAEADYRHEVVVVSLSTEPGGTVKTRIETVDVPVTTPMICIGSAAKPLPKAEVLERLAALDAKQPEADNAPYLEIHVALTGPDLTLQHEVKELLADKAVRLTRILAHYPKAKVEAQRVVSNIDELQRLSPAQIFERYYQNKFPAQAMPDAIRELFDDVVGESLNLQQ